MWNSVVSLDGCDLEKLSEDSTEMEKVIVKLRNVAADSMMMAGAVLDHESDKFNIDEVSYMEIGVYIYILTRNLLNMLRNLVYIDGCANGNLR